MTFVSTAPTSKRFLYYSISILGEQSSKNSATGLAAFTLEAEWPWCVPLGLETDLRFTVVIAVNTGTLIIIKVHALSFSLTTLFLLAVLLLLLISSLSPSSSSRGLGVSCC